MLTGAPSDSRAAKLAEIKRLRAEVERRERVRLANVDAFAVLGYEPICIPRIEARKRGDALIPEPCGGCPQELFHAATEDSVLFGGAAGGGKPAAVCIEACRAAVKHPGIRVLILRRTYDELAESIFPEFQRINWAAALGGRWNKTEKEISFRNGSIIRLRYMDSIDDASRRQGGAYQLICVDELTLMPPGAVDVVALERLRSAHGVPVLGLRASSNPGGPSHGEVRKRYIEATEHGRVVVTDENGLTRRFIPAKATHNPYLNESYHRQLDAIPDPARRAAMRDGDWGQFSGQIFVQWRHDRHTIAPMALPAGWKRYNGIDWGFTNPWVCLWAAQDPDGRVWVYREIYERQVGEADQARSLLAAEADDERVLARYADDSVFATRGDARPISEVWSQNGVYVTAAGKGPNSRVTGLQRIHTFMAEAPACAHHRAAGWATCPNLHVFRTCGNLIHEIENLPYARKGNVEDSDPAADDHATDALRYLLINVGGGAQFIIPDDPPATVTDGIQLMAPHGQYAVRPDQDEPDWLLDGDGAEPVNRGGQPSPFG